MKLKGERDNSTTIAGDFFPLISATYRNTRQKSTKIKNQKNSINQLDIFTEYYTNNIRIHIILGTYVSL
jgi:hypothetical protein